MAPECPKRYRGDKPSGIESKYSRVTSKLNIRSSGTFPPLRVKSESQCKNRDDPLGER